MRFRGVRIMRDFAVSEQLVASPVFDDFFRFFYEMMAIVGLLIALLGHVCRTHAHQRLVAGVLCAVNFANTLHDLSTSDSAFGNRLYRGEGTLAPVVIGLVISLAFGWLFLRPTPRASRPASVG
jgi:hypothetical protein